MKTDFTKWAEELKAAGWKLYERNGRVMGGGTIWQDPEGNLYRGPYGAWVVLKDRERHSRVAQHFAERPDTPDAEMAGRVVKEKE